MLAKPADITSRAAVKTHRSLVATAASSYLPELLAFNSTRNELLLSEFELRPLVNVKQVQTTM